MARVSVAGDSLFREQLESQGFIPNFRWKEGTYHECAILKVATKPDSEDFYIGLLPSWVLFEELTSTTVQINQINKIGNYTYEVNESFENNISRFLTGKSFEEASEGMVDQNVNTDLEGFVNSYWVSKNYYSEIPKLQELAKENNRLEIFNWLKEHLLEIKTKFIKTRTQLLVPSGIVVSTKVNDSFRNGTLENSKEAIKTVNKYFKLTDAIMRDKFKEGNNGVGFDTPGVDTKSIREKYNTFLFRKGEPLTRPRSTGIVFMATREVIMFNDDWQPKMDENKSTDFKLAYYTLNSKAKYDKINSRRVSPKVDVHLDYVMLRFEYEGSNKAEAGRNMAVTDHNRELTPKEVFQIFLPALPEASYNKCFELQKYPLEDVIGQVTIFINSNNKHLENLSGEERERLGDSLDLIKDTVNTDTIDDVLSKASQSFQEGLQNTKNEVEMVNENSQLNSNQMQQPKQPQQMQQPQQQPQQQPRQQMQQQPQQQMQQPQWNQGQQPQNQQSAGTGYPEVQQFGQQSPNNNEQFNVNMDDFSGVDFGDFSM